MRFTRRFTLVILLIVGLCDLPVMAAGSKAAPRRVLGVVVEADRAHLDRANAVSGADIYSCDSLDTDEGGVLRVKVGPNQLYLSASSAAALEDDGSAVQALVTVGTVGFSLPASTDFSVRTPAGIIRAAGAGAASGQVSFVNPKELMIAAVRGDLVLDTGGEMRTIPEGKSAAVTFDEGLDNGCHDEAGAGQPPQSPVTQPKIGFLIIAAAAVGIPSFFLWHNATESNSKPNQ